MLAREIAFLAFGKGLLWLNEPPKMPTPLLHLQPILEGSSRNRQKNSAYYDVRGKSLPRFFLLFPAALRRYSQSRERCSSGPNAGFEILVPGRQDGYGH